MANWLLSSKIPKSVIFTWCNEVSMFRYPAKAVPRYQVNVVFLSSDIQSAPKSKVEDTMGLTVMVYCTRLLMRQEYPKPCAHTLFADLYTPYGGLASLGAFLRSHSR